MEKIKPEILVEKLPGDIASEGLKKDDYVITRPADFYSGAGIYVLKTGGNSMVARCIEKTDGSIHVAVGFFNSMVARCIEKTNHFARRSTAKCLPA